MPKHTETHEWVPIEVTPVNAEDFEPIEVSPLPQATPVVADQKPATGKSKED